jgi:hypothetical protein
MMSKAKANAVDKSSILSDATFLQQIFSFLPGNWLFLGVVCRAWMLSYKQMPASRCKTLTSKLYGISVRELTLSWSSTLMTAVFESPARLRWEFRVAST